MLEKSTRTKASSWRARATRFAPPALAAAALLAGSPSISPAQSGWKWFGTQAPAPVQAPKPANGFSKAVLRLMEQARQEALAGNYEAAIQTAQRAHKISDAAAGVLGADPECSPELTKKFLTDMVALADATRVPAASISRTSPTQTLQSQPAQRIASQAVPAPNSPAVLPQQPFRMHEPNIPPAPKLAATMSVPLNNSQAPVAKLQPAPAPVQTPMTQELAVADSPVVVEKAPEISSIPATPIDTQRPHPSDRDIPSIDEVRLYEGDQFAILGGDEESYPAASMARLPEFPFEEVAVNDTEETAQRPALLLRRVIWSSRDTDSNFAAVDDAEFEPAGLGNPFDPEPAPVVVQETQLQAETAQTETQPETDLVDEPDWASETVIAQEPVAQVEVVPQSSTPSTAESLYSLTFDFNEVPQVGTAGEPVAQAEVPAPPAVAAPLPETEIIPVQQPATVASGSLKIPSKPVAIRKFAVDNALLTTQSPVETVAVPATEAAIPATSRDSTPIHSPASAEFESSIGPAVVPTEWSSASPEKSPSVPSARPWTDSAWEPAKTKTEVEQPEVAPAPAPRQPVETSSTHSTGEHPAGDIVQASFVTTFSQERTSPPASVLTGDQALKAVVSLPKATRSSVEIDPLLLIPRPSTVVRQTTTAIQMEAEESSAEQSEPAITATGLRGWSWGSLYSICGLSLFALGVACFQLRSHSTDTI